MNLLDDTKRHIRALEMMLDSHNLTGYIVLSNAGAYVKDFKQLKAFIASPVKGQLNPGVVLGPMHAQRFKHYHHARSIANMLRDHEGNAFYVKNARTAIVEEIAQQRAHLKWLEEMGNVNND